MPLIQYKKIRFKSKTKKQIEQANAIIHELAEQGYDLTLRQLYYQLVARGIIENKVIEYKRLGQTVSDARLAGIIDWGHIVDRTRRPQKNSHWESPRDIISSCVDSYGEDLWASQRRRVEVWIEKDALVGVLASVCAPLDVGFFSCRGYTSQTAMWRAAMRLQDHIRAGQRPVILHLGDHDPSGMDMSRDIFDRIEMFTGENIEIRRIALNMNQVRKYKPPPNPAKVTDSRYKAYIARYGDQSWELDALDPRVLKALIEGEVKGLCQPKKMAAARRHQERGRERLVRLVRNWRNK